MEAEKIRQAIQRLNEDDTTWEYRFVIDGEGYHIMSGYQKLESTKYEWEIEEIVKNFQERCEAEFEANGRRYYVNADKRILNLVNTLWEEYRYIVRVYEMRDTCEGHVLEVKVTTGDNIIEEFEITESDVDKTDEEPWLDALYERMSDFYIQVQIEEASKYWEKPEPENPEVDEIRDEW